MSCPAAATRAARSSQFRINKPFLAFMLPRKLRLTTDKDVTRVLKKGRAVFTNLLIVKALGNDLGGVRATVIVSTKVHKRAVKRNLVKRRVRSLLEAIIPTIHKGVDIVVMAQPESVGRTQVDLGAALDFCLKKQGLV
jgi:ribonuclease P protein component